MYVQYYSGRFHFDMFIDSLNVKSLQILEITDHRFTALIPVSRLTCLSYVDPLMGTNHIFNNYLPFYNCTFGRDLSRLSRELLT